MARNGDKKMLSVTIRMNAEQKNYVSNFAKTRNISESEAIRVMINSDMYRPALEIADIKQFIEKARNEIIKEIISIKSNSKSDLSGVTAPEVEQE